MSVHKKFGKSVLLSLCVACAAIAAPGTGLIADGDFTATKSSGDLRKDSKGGDWYESRRDGVGHKLLFLSKKAIAGNATPKALIRGNTKVNTYLTQPFATPQKGDFTVQFDILVNEILQPANHSAFIMVGNSKDKKGGPNSTGLERFVFMGFENGAAGKVNLIARPGKTEWAQKKVIASGLDLNKWYTIEAVVHAATGKYDVTVKGVTAAPVQVDAFAASGKPPKELTHVSFASWNDGPGTFYVDNVVVHP
jgi:hypothetical protein